VQKQIVCTWIAELLLAKIEEMRASEISRKEFTPVDTSSQKKIKGPSAEQSQKIKVARERQLDVMKSELLLFLRENRAFID